MNIQELRDKVIEKIKDFHLSIKETEDIVFDLFAEFNRSQKSFPKENQASELPKDTKEYINLWGEFEKLKIDINFIHEKIGNLHHRELEEMQKKIKCLDEMRDDISELSERIDKDNERVESKIDDFQKEIEPIQKEIFELSCFRKKFGECLDDQRNDLSLLKKHILDLQDELLTLKRDLKFENEQEKSKAERFTFREYKELDTINKIYDVLDSKNKLYFRTLFEYTQAKDVCENLNSLAKGE